MKEKLIKLQKFKEAGVIIVLLLMVLIVGICNNSSQTHSRSYRQVDPSCDQYHGHRQSDDNGIRGGSQQIGHIGDRKKGVIADAHNENH